jgi:hypothetical protein
MMTHKCSHYIFDKKEQKQELERFGIGSWIITIVLITVGAGLALFGIATFIKFAIWIWGM